MSIRGAGTGIVSCLPYLDGGRDLSSREVSGGYVECQSASVTGTRPGDGGLTVVEKDKGEVGRVLPREDGRELGGDSRSRVGSFGDGTLCCGEPGLDGGRELLEYLVSTGTGLDLLVPPFNEEEEECGDWAYGLSLGEPVDSRLRGGDGCLESGLLGVGLSFLSRKFALRSSFCRSLLTKL